MHLIKKYLLDSLLSKKHYNFQAVIVALIISKIFQSLHQTNLQKHYL